MKDIDGIFLALENFPGKFLYFPLCTAIHDAPKKLSDSCNPSSVLVTRIGIPTRFFTTFTIYVVAVIGSNSHAF